MKVVPLFTSIPNKTTRLSKNGEDLGEQYQAECINSWLRSGFIPYTLNSEREELLGLSPLVTRIKVAKDCSAEYQKPLLYLHDFIQTICGQFEGVVAITNADIILELSDDDFGMLQTLKPKECIVLKRYDIKQSCDRVGSVYIYGYDFFAAHTDDLRKIQCASFAIGMPWWDHFLPLWLQLNGVRGRAINNRSVFHLIHNERWNWKIWEQIGVKFQDELIGSLDKNIRNAPITRQYLGEIRRSKGISNLTLKGRLKMWLKQQHKKGRQELLVPSLFRMSAANIKQIDGWVS